MMKFRHGFTLVELLVVMAILGLTVALISPAVRGLMQGSQLTQAGSKVTGFLGLARQTAISQNSCVEVRFYNCGDPLAGGSGDSWHIRAMQSFLVQDSGAVAVLGKVQYLPDTAILDGGSTLSSIFDSSKRVYNASPTLAIPRISKSYGYYALQFRPDGSTNLSPTISGSSQLWFMTLHSTRDGDKLTTPPPNFWTIQIDSINGTATSYRP
ncbi:MAG: Verru_Chthon cassette protein D [Chthoniobacteraceae bacterium]